MLQTPDQATETIVQAETLKEAFAKSLPDDTMYCWGHEIEDMS